jgi:hypothetical protein
VAFKGSIEVDGEGNFVFGKIIGICDVVTFEASSCNKTCSLQNKMQKLFRISFAVSAFNF